MKGTKKLRRLKKCVALLMVAFMLITMPGFEGGTVKAAELVPDAGLRAAIKQSMINQGMTPTDEITKEQLAQIKTIYISTFTDYTVSDLTGLEYCVNLESLTVSSSNITTLPDLSGLKKLTYVDLSRNEELSDISGLKGTTSITHLNLESAGRDSKVTDITPIAGNKNLSYLELENVNITEGNAKGYMNTLSGLTNLKTLRMFSVNMTDQHTSAFSNMSKLETLVLNGNDISDTTFLLKNKNSLRELCLSDNPVGNDNILGQLTNLEILELRGTEITDFSFFAKLPKLTDESIRIRQWQQDSPVTILIDYRDINVAGTETKYVVKNEVKDNNGKIVVPNASEEYSYNAATNEITIPLVTNTNLTSVDITYDLAMKVASGDTLYATVKKSFYINREPVLKITKQPEDLEKNDGEGATFYVEASGAAYLNYKWYKDGKLIQETKDAWYRDKLYIENVSKDDAGEYYVVVTDRNYGTLTKEEVSETVTLTVNVTPLEITTQPTDVEANEGKNIYFAVWAKGTGTLTYQWYKDGEAIDGATSRTYSKQNVSVSDAGKYYVVVTDKYGTVKSEEATAVINAIPLKITTQPAGVTIDEGGKATLEVQATGNGTLTYQWYKDEKPIDGATNAILEIPDAKVSDSGEYYVVVKDIRNIVTSSKAVIKVDEKSTEAPSTEAPSTEAPSTEAPATQSPAEGPATGDGPIVAVCVTLLLAAMASIVLARLRKNTI